MLGRVGRRGFAGCRKVVVDRTLVVVDHKEAVVVDRMEAAAGRMEAAVVDRKVAVAGAGIDLEERRSPGFEEEELHSSVLAGKVSGHLGEDIDLGAGNVVADDLGLARRNSRCLTSCLLF